MEIKGKVWNFGDHIDTDQILPGHAMAESFDSLGKFAMTGSDIPDFPEKAAEGAIIVAGKNFGCGSSREQAPVALKLAGVRAVVAQSYARIFRRNAINIGLPVLMADTSDMFQNGVFAEVDLERGILVAEGKELEIKPLSDTVMDTLKAGGLINRVRAELKREGKL